MMMKIVVVMMIQVVGRWVIVLGWAARVRGRKEMGESGLVFEALADAGSLLLLSMICLSVCSVLFVFSLSQQIDLLQFPTKSSIVNLRHE